jgi:DNA repair photolyase
MTREWRRAGIVCIEIEAKSILNRVAGMPFAWSINPYRGCYHECTFCYARRTHEFFKLDGVGEWGSQLYAKVNAPAVLRTELARPSWRYEEVAIGTATDPYQPLEGTYRLTRGILSEFVRVPSPVHVTTRSPLSIRDIDVMQALSARAEFSISLSLPTLDADLARKIEPGVAPPRKRLAALERLAAAGIRAGIAVAPILPNLTDDPDALRAVLCAARDCGASFVWHNILNLGDVARESFFALLAAEFPDLSERYRAWYRTRYAPRSLHERVEQAYSSAARGIRFDPPEAIAAPPLRQLELFGSYFCERPASSARIIPKSPTTSGPAIKSSESSGCESPNLCVT